MSDTSCEPRGTEPSAVSDITNVGFPSVSGQEHFWVPQDYTPSICDMKPKSGTAEPHIVKAYERIFRIAILL